MLTPTFLISYWARNTAKLVSALFSLPCHVRRKREGYI